MTTPQSAEDETVTLAEEFAGLGASYASVGRETIEMIEARSGGPGRQRGFAELGEALLEAVDGFAGAGIARGDGAAGAGVAPFKMDVADGEADGAAFIGAKKLVFPEGGDAIDLQSSAEAEAEVVDGEAFEPS